MDRHEKLILGLLLTLASFFLCSGYLDKRGDFEDLKHQAIERGYALYCPRNGQFAWVGECEEEE